ncbi:MAG TPA: DNA polymerase III subunit alpha [Patescibacteria group bacterium]|nr:DNA polymerase III subunit alpha [Patescibacteria group bacterium]
MYIPLHVHTVNSPYRGMITLPELVSRASFLKFPAVAVTDHMTTYGHFEFFRLAGAAGVKPVLGAEIRHASLIGRGGWYHLTVLAENNTGYRNLVSLVNRHYAKGKDAFVTADEIAEHREGLIVLTGCSKGETSQAILHGNLGREREVVEKLLDIFDSGHLFIELMNHSLDREQLVIEHLARLSKRTGVPLVVTNNDRYINEEEGEYFEVLDTLRRKGNAGTLEKEPGVYQLRKRKELEPYFYTFGNALDVSGEIAERCDVDLSIEGRILFTANETPDDTLQEMCKRRLLLAYHSASRVEVVHLRTVMDKELSKVREEGLSGFLLFFRDVIVSAVRSGICLEIVGGEMLNSFVCHLLGIVPLNPVAHGLIFESFASRRPGVPPALELIHSERNKERLLAIMERLLHGHQILFQVSPEAMSFHTIVKEIGEVSGISPQLQEELSRILSPMRRFRNLAATLDGSEALRGLYNSEENVRAILHAAHALAGRIVHFTLNASRLVVLPREAERMTAFITGTNGECYALCGNTEVEAMGGWTLVVQHSHYLSALVSTVNAVTEGRTGRRECVLFDGGTGEDWTLGGLDDARTYALIASGETMGVYQLESQGIRDLLMQIRPENFDELVNAVSLYRPAPLEGRLWQRYVENAEKKGKVYLPHHRLAAPLENTRGLLLFREQVREILLNCAGFEGERAVSMERALQKRDAGELLSARLDFIRGAMEGGIDEEDAQKIFDYLLHNIQYTHDKALSCSQAYLSYRTAFLKVHFYLEYFASLLNNNLDVRERQKRYLDYLREREVPVLPVDVNLSGKRYVVEGDGIREPILNSRHLGTGELDEIVAERDRGGEFASFRDFIGRMSGKLSMEAVLGLIEEDLFAGEGKERGELVRIYQEFLGHEGAVGSLRPVQHGAQQRKKRESTRQLSFFEGDDS